MALGLTLAAVVVVLVLWSGALAGTPTIEVTVAGTPAGVPVPRAFIGLSIEYSSATAYLGDDPSAPNETFVRLVRALAPSGHPVLRFGGDSTDWTWWPVPGMRTPGGIRYSLGPQWVDVVRATARALGARLILGINLETDSKAIAKTEALSLLHGLGRSLIAGFELGNEPELYRSGTWYTTARGVAVRGRHGRYPVAAYVPDFERISAVLPGSVPLVGPASGAPKWVAAVMPFVASNPRVRLITFHVYPLDRCFTKRSSPHYPTIPNLLSPAAAQWPVTFLAQAISSARALRLPLRVDELNSVSCKGANGVSNTFASALWAVEALFELAQDGVEGVNIHTLAGAMYQPFTFAQVGTRWLAQVAPLYYGLLLFDRAAPAGSRLLPTTHEQAPSLRTWATLGRNGAVRVVLINVSPSRTLELAVRSPLGARAATVERLRAPGLTARSGVELAGQSFGALSATGVLAGRQKLTSVRARAGSFFVELPPASAALLTVR